MCFSSGKKPCAGMFSGLDADSKQRLYTIASIIYGTDDVKSPTKNIAY